MTIYLLALAFGGTLLGASLLLGGKGEHPALGDGGGDAGAGHGDHAGHDHLHDHHDVGAAEVVAWLPLTSLRFWSFFLAFAGAIGCALTVTGALASAALIAALAGGTGWLTGVGAVTAVRLAGRKDADSMTRPGELVGATGVLLLGAGPGQPGKVRLDAKGRQQDFVVTTDDPAPLATGTTVLVVGAAADGRLIVTRGDDLTREGSEST
ncbi:MAG: hypothetical protein R2939_06120 [Kofleriaceae bacterium]